MSRFPVDQIKIDRDFVARIPEDKRAADITAAVVGLAHKLGFSVVGEGVETPVQLGFLKACGCDQIQGYLFSSPVPAAEIVAMFSEGRRIDVGHHSPGDGDQESLR